MSRPAELEEARRLIQRPVVPLLGFEKQFRQRLHPYQADDKHAAQQQTREGKQVEDAAQPLPALALWIVKDLLVHLAIRATRRMRLRPIVCSRLSRVNARR